MFQLGLTPSKQRIQEGLQILHTYNPFSHSDGTTDVTRTVHFGTPTQHEKVNTNTVHCKYTDFDIEFENYLRKTSKQETPRDQNNTKGVSFGTNLCHPQLEIKYPLTGFIALIMKTG